MIVSTKGRYALRVMIDLAEHQSDKYVPLKEVAARQEISEKYLENILKVLVQNGFLEGLRGKGGGYRLTRKEGSDNSIRLMTGVEFPMTFTDKGNGHKVTVDADESFTNGVLWQQDAENFVCMEPWNGWANSVNEEGKHEVLEPDEAMTSEWTITIEKV